MHSPIRRPDADQRSAVAGATPSWTSREVVRAHAHLLRKDNKPEEAIDVWRQFLDQNPKDAEAANELGLVFLGLDRFEEALQWFRHAMAVHRGLISAKLNAGIALRQLKRFEEAVSSFQDVLARNPDHPAACFNLGVSLHALDRHDKALRWLQRAFDLRPSHAESAYELGNVLRALNRDDQAIEAYRQALALQPDCVGALLSLGALQHEGKQFGEAATTYQRAVGFDPFNHTGWLGLGGALLGARRHADALAAYRQALTLQPASSVAYCNMALALMALGRIEEAIAACRKAIALEPESPVPHFNLGCLLLSLGNFREGWSGYEYRYAISGNKWPLAAAHAAPWTGEALTGKSILILGEQGNGDQIQFARYLSALSDLGVSVFFLLTRRLHRLFETLRGSIKLVSELPPNSRFDYQCPLMSLPGLFEQLGLAVPSAPYLAAEPERVARWRKRVGNDGVRVGVVWQGHRPTGDADVRSFRLETLRPLARIPGVRLIGLQWQEGKEQMGTLPVGMHVEELGPDFDTGDHGFVDAAAVLEVLDLIVTCDTSIAHLAGALGRPVWIALHQTAEWRWQRDRTDCIWYPTARLFRQEQDGDWDGVFLRMAHALKQQVAASTSQTIIADARSAPLAVG
jgi:tetratricopeptide (TPR) repeat protein